MRLADFTLDPATGVRTLGESTSYRDGAEQYLLDGLAGLGDRSVGSAEVAALVRDWPSLYHLSPYRSTLFDCLGLDGIAGARVLELGAGCGAMTRWMGERGAEVHAIEGGVSRAEVARVRCLDLEGVELYAGNFSDLDERGFDVVTLIGVLEYGHLYHPVHTDPRAAALANLELAARSLGERGVLILAIENRMGLKYLNGAREDHSGRDFEGIQGYPAPGSPVTWSLRELEGMLRTAGFGHCETLVPYPDYKLASGVINPARASDEERIHNWIANPAPDRGNARRPLLFNESLAVREVARAGLLAELANSHLVLAFRGDAGAVGADLGIDLDWSARHYSLDRRPGLRKRNTLRAGTVVVDTATDAAELAALREFGISFEAASEPLAPGDLAILGVHEALAAEGIGARFAALLREHREWLLERFGAGEAGGIELVGGEAFDAVWWNVVVHPRTGERQLIDREWRLELPIPADYVLWRMLTAFFSHHAVQLGARHAERPHEELVEEALALAGVTPSAALVDAFRELEGALIRAIQNHPSEPPAGRCPELERWSQLDGAPRSFAVIAFADEVVERPELLAGFARHFSAEDPATLVLYAPGADEATAGGRIESALAAAGVGEDSPDMMLLTAAATDGSEAAIAGGANALLSERDGAGVFALLPRCGASEVGELRPYAEALWAS